MERPRLKKIDRLRIGQAIKPDEAPVIVGFDYELVDPETAEKLRRTAERFHRLSRSILDMGRELRDRREDCFSGGQGKNAGLWGAWLDGEFGLDRRTALRYVAASELVDGGPDILSNLRPSCIYALAAADMPAAVDEVAERLERGDELRGKEVREIIDARKKKAAQLRKGGDEGQRKKSAKIDLERGTTFTSDDPHPADDEDGNEADAAEDLKEAISKIIRDLSNQRDSIEEQVAQLDMANVDREVRLALVDALRQSVESLEQLASSIEVLPLELVDIERSHGEEAAS